jgi:hypothetical protein
MKYLTIALFIRHNTTLHIPAEHRKRSESLKSAIKIETRIRSVGYHVTRLPAGHDPGCRERRCPGRRDGYRESPLDRGSDLLVRPDL